MNFKLTTLLFLPAAAMLLLAGCGETSQRPPVNIDATVEARVGQALTAVPTPTARVEEKIVEVLVEPVPLPTYTPLPIPTPQVIIKEVIVEKVVVVTATPTPAPTPTPTATPLEAFEGTIHIASQTGVMVHDVNWSLINNSRQEVTLVNAEIYNDSGRMVGLVVFGESLALAAGRERSVGTTFMNATEEQVMTYQFVWTFRVHTGETIVCTFSITNPKSCLRNLIDGT